MVAQRQPSFYALQPLKHQLAEELGPERAAAQFAELAGYEPGWGVRTFGVAGLRDFALEHALEYEVVAESRDVVLAPPSVFGEVPGTPLPMRTRELFFCVLADAVIACKSGFVLIPEHDAALLDFQNDELSQLPVDLDVDPVAFAPTGDGITALLGRGAFAGASLERALDLTGLHSFNFGHWLTEFLPKVLVCIDRPGFDSVPVVVDEQMPVQHREALALIIGPEHPVVALKPREAIRVKELWACSTVMYFEIGTKQGEAELNEVLPIDGAAFAGLLAKIEPRLSAVTPHDGPERIYVSRKDSQHKRLVNRVEVERWFAGQGFDIYEPASLTFAEQLARVRGAEVIAGPEGSGPWLALWARPGTAIGLLDNPYIDQYWPIAELFAPLGIRLSTLVGPVVRVEPSYVKFSDYEIDVDALPAFIADLVDQERQG
jgi:hypothetical protein